MKKIRKKKKLKSIIGSFCSTRHGFGFVKPNDYISDDIFIPARHTKNAVNDDTVEVAIETWKKKGAEGKIVKIVKRAHTHLFGIVVKLLPNDKAIIFAPLLAEIGTVNISVPKKEKVQIGDRIVVKVTKWGHEINGHLERSIGNINSPEHDFESTIAEFNILRKIPNPVKKELKLFPLTVSAKEILKRKDLRELECFTIDPKTSKDFDDALSITKTKDGYQLGVHIADVSHYVKPGSALDKEAANRCNSTYLPGKCISMLPEQLSNNLCSLKPNVNRLVVSVFMDFDKKGVLKNYKIERSVIKSKKRFTYEEVTKIIENKKKSPHKKSLDNMVSLCKLLKKWRYRRGSIEFFLPGTNIAIDDSGIPHSITIEDYDISHQLVEEFMLKTNEVIAKHILSEKKGSIYRVHKSPNQNKLEDFAYLGKALGFAIHKTPTNQELQNLFEEAQKTPYAKILSVLFVKSMKIANYSTNNEPHFGLCLEHYTHFTSPIRRYIDLIIHRILFSKKKTQKSLLTTAISCSEQERKSKRAEQVATLLKKLRYLNECFKKNPNRKYDAIITNITPFGFAFEIVNFVIEEFISVNNLPHYVKFDTEQHCLTGKSTTYFYGQKLKLKLEKVDLINLKTKWQIK